MLNKEKIVKELEAKYPGKKILCDPEDAPTEIICEIEPTEEGKESNSAIAIVGKSKPHYHKEATEVYECLKGELTVFIEDKKHILREGESVIIEPGKVHHAEGEETWFITYSTPGWKFEDHIVIKE